MSQSLYHNPFMPTRHLNPRASGLIVFGGGGGGTPAPVAPVAPVAPYNEPIKTMDDGSNPGKFEYTHTEIKGSQQRAVLKNNVTGQTQFGPYYAKGDMTSIRKSAADLLPNVNKSFDTWFKTDSGKTKDREALAAYKAAISSAIANAPSEGMDELGKLQNQLNAVLTVPKPTSTHEPTAAETGAEGYESFDAQIQKAYDSSVTGLQGKISTTQQTAATEISTGQRNLVKKAITDPASLTTEQEVANIDPNATGTSIGTNVGRLNPFAPTATTSTVDMNNPQVMGGDYQPPAPEVSNAGVVYDSMGRPIQPAPQPSSSFPMPEGFDLDPQRRGQQEQERARQQFESDRARQQAYDNRPRTGFGGGIRTGSTSGPGGGGTPMPNFDLRPPEDRTRPQPRISDPQVSAPYLQPEDRTIQPQGQTTGLAVAADPTDITASTVGTATSQTDVKDALKDTEAAQGTVSDDSVATAATMEPTDTAVSDLTAAQGEAIVMNNPTTREIQAGELITGSADATKAAAFTEQVEAAQATPSDKATVKGQLTELMQDFEGGATPPWAAGALRNATAAMAQRGLGASSMAGQALVQAAMESALPIAAADAQTVAGFEMANLSNRQQRAMLAAEQRAAFIGQEFDQNFQAKVQNASRIADVANMNFTAEQQIALENSRNANSMNMANLTNRQALIMGEAAAISNLEMANLSNQQQAALQNAQTFLQMDMANLNNRQQTEMFKSQSMIQSIFTDQAATNASLQFNASSENQTKQFMASMRSQVNQFNASQTNSMSQFNVNEMNGMAKFNSDMRNQRDQFNATNQLVIAQANAQWRQSVVTMNTAAQNEANAEAARTSNAFTASTLDQIWQRERDMMSMAWKSSESSAERANAIIMAQMGVAAQKEALATQAAAEKSSAIGSFFAQLLFS
jgi:hypothetical protein